MQGWSLPEAKRRCETGEVTLLLEQGKLAGYARPGGQENDPVAIPRSAWSDIEIVDEAGLCLVHRPSKAEFLDLLIYPVLHAPDAPELLHDKGLADAFMMTVVRDPEVAALGRHLLKTKDFRHVFLDGNAPSPYIDSHWLIDLDEDSIAFEFVRPIMWFAGDPLPRPSSAMTAAATALADRFAALRMLLSSGRLAVSGTHHMSGLLLPIPRTQWLRKNLAIDVANGDLCEGGQKWSAHWTGILLEYPSPKPDVSLEMRFREIIAGNPRSLRSSNAAETRCRIWLEQLVNEHPTGRPKAKGELLKEAKQKWPGLSDRSFERCWVYATANEAATGWRTGGRPRKSPASKTPAAE